MNCIHPSRLCAEMKSVSVFVELVGTLILLSGMKSVKEARMRCDGRMREEKECLLWVPTAHVV